MIWSRLKNFRCPADNKLLYESKPAGVEMYLCTEPFCKFMISKARFDRMVDQMYRSGKRYSPPDSYTAMPVEDFTSGASDEPSEHDKFWLNKAAHE